MQEDAVKDPVKLRATQQGVGYPTGDGVAAGAVFIVIAAVAAFSLSSEPHLRLQTGELDPGAAFVPWIAVWILGIGGLGQIGLTLFHARRARGLRSCGEFALRRLWLPLVLLFTLCGYLLLLEPFGFVAAGTLFSAPWIAVLHWRSGDRLKPIHALLLPIEALLIVGLIDAIFRYGIHVPLP
jgi:hypothetical protein